MYNSDNDTRTYIGTDETKRTQIDADHLYSQYAQATQPYLNQQTGAVQGAQQNAQNYLTALNNGQASVAQARQNYAVNSALQGIPAQNGSGVYGMYKAGAGNLGNTLDQAAMGRAAETNMGNQVYGGAQLGAAGQYGGQADFALNQLQAAQNAAAQSENARQGNESAAYQRGTQAASSAVGAASTIGAMALMASDEQSKIIIDNLTRENAALKAQYGQPQGNTMDQVANAGKAAAPQMTSTPGQPGSSDKPSGNPYEDLFNKYFKAFGGRAGQRNPALEERARRAAFNERQQMLDDREEAAWIPNPTAIKEYARLKQQRADEYEKAYWDKQAQDGVPYDMSDPQDVAMQKYEMSRAMPRPEQPNMSVQPQIQSEEGGQSYGPPVDLRVERLQRELGDGSLPPVNVNTGGSPMPNFGDGSLPPVSVSTAGYYTPAPTGGNISDARSKVLEGQLAAQSSMNAKLVSQLANRDERIAKLAGQIAPTTGRYLKGPNGEAAFMDDQGVGHTNVRVPVERRSPAFHGAVVDAVGGYDESGRRYMDEHSPIPIQPEVQIPGNFQVGPHGVSNFVDTAGNPNTLRIPERPGTEVGNPYVATSGQPVSYDLRLSQPEPVGTDLAESDERAKDVIPGDEYVPSEADRLQELYGAGPQLPNAGNPIPGDEYVSSDRSVKKTATPRLIHELAKRGINVPGGDPMGGAIDQMMDKTKPHAFKYKDSADMGHVGALPHNRVRPGIVLQDLEKSPLGATLVLNTPKGKMFDVPSMTGANTAMIARLNERLRKLETKGKRHG